MSWSWEEINPHQCCAVSPNEKSGTGTKKSQFSSNKLKPAASYTQRNAPTFRCVKLHERNVLFLPSTCAAVTKRGRFPNSAEPWFWWSVSQPASLQEPLRSCTVQDVTTLNEGTLTARANGEVTSLSNTFLRGHVLYSAVMAWLKTK